MFALLGHASMRAFRVMPDFPEKAAMMRGARWGAVALLGLSLASVGTISLGLRLGLICASGGLAHAILLSGFFALFYRFQVESEGLFAGARYWLNYRHKGWEPWIKEWRSRQLKVKRQWRVMVFLWPVLILVWLSFAAWGYWHIDRMFLASIADERLGTALKQELNDLHVVEVVPMRSSFEGPLYPLMVHVTPGTTAQQAQQLAERTRQAFALGHDRYAWNIHVRPEHGKIIGRALYTPPGVLLPPGIERQPPRPRDW